MLTEIDHVAIAVGNIEEAVAFYRRVFAAEVVHRERIEADQVEEALIRVADSYIQLIAATSPESTVARFLAKHGEGLHHVGYRVQDAGAAVKSLKAEGVKMIDEVPRPGSRGTTVAFVHPGGALGTLIELVEEP